MYILHTNDHKWAKPGFATGRLSQKINLSWGKVDSPEIKKMFRIATVSKEGYTDNLLIHEKTHHD